MFPWKPNLKPVAATGVAQRKLLVLKINQAALYLESQPTHSPQKKKKTKPKRHLSIPDKGFNKHVGKEERAEENTTQ